ncbi:MAG: hypothetical protein AVDCRST_MAG70-2316 [uncultured Thermomicrobiales bacterium]|uniref:Uncharacterized protein n=1 Tax=uncultured Thermomicrobiales bacterium TaxID=1645740 RepID=A0A6J4VAM4_9BACT|nr:MAG: hypothetical protein AVDCRST_MAG70-2316 [uncultured Thermomicrobiales bacterium]
MVNWPVPCPLTHGHWPRCRCADLRCVAPDHQALRSPTGERPPFTPPVVPLPPTLHQVRLGPRRPAERPAGMPEREWVLLTELVAGRTVAEIEMVKVIGVSRQHGLRPDAPPVTNTTWPVKSLEIILCSP